MSNALSAALGAVVVIASLFGFQVLADRVFVTRREFEQFKVDLEKRLARIESTMDTRLAEIVLRMDKTNERLAVLIGAKALSNERHDG